MLATLSRSFSTSPKHQFKVAVLGAAGGKHNLLFFTQGIGQPLSLLLKMNPLITDLRLYDIVNTPGVAADLSHINTPAVVTGFKGVDQLAACLKGADVVVIPAGIPRKPGMTRDDLFNTNATIIKNIAKVSAVACPKAHILMIANPVNSTVPIFAEVLKKNNVYDPKRLYGVTTLDIVRSSTFVAGLKGKDCVATKVNVVGGHSGVTIIPLLSQTGIKFSEEEVVALTKRIQFGGDEVVKAKDGTGSATLSMGQAGARFTNSLLKALSGEKGIVEAAYVESNVAGKDGVSFFSTNVELGLHGVQKIHPIGAMNAFEQKLYEAAIPDLKSNIKNGVDFVAKNY